MAYVMNHGNDLSIRIYPFKRKSCYIFLEKLFELPQVKEGDFRIDFHYKE